MNELTGKIQTEIKKVIVGKDDVVRRVLMAILAQGHVLLEDVPGVGKTTLAMAFAKTLGLKTARVQSFELQTANVKFLSGDLKGDTLF